MYSEYLYHILQTNKQIIHKQYFNEPLITDAPVPEPVKTIYGLQLERTAFVTVTIQSNPRPNTHWNIDNNIHMNEGDTRDRYEAQAPKEVVSRIAILPAVSYYLFYLSKKNPFVSIKYFSGRWQMECYLGN